MRIKDTKMGRMKDDFYDTMSMKWVLSPFESKKREEPKPPSPEVRAMKEKAWKKVFPEGSNQDELNKMAIDYWTEVAKEDAINPSHYKGIVGTLQYIEVMEEILGKEGLRAHLMGQGYKYLMRMGKKDAEAQELKKAIWYFRCLEILLRDGTIIGRLKELE